VTRRPLFIGVGVAVLLSQPSTAWAQAVGPDTTIAMSHSGNFTVGVNGVYTIVVTNIGRTATSGLTSVVDELIDQVSFHDGYGLVLLSQGNQ
jgi:hypothetical protein